MSLNEKRMLDREALRSVIQQWNANRLDLFELSEPNENLEFHGVMRFYFQDTGQKVATKCIRVASDATVADVIETLIEKFRPDMRMLSVPNYALYEVHANGEERKLNADEKPLLVQLNWHIDDREGRFLLRNLDVKPVVESPVESTQFKRKLSKREKKEQKKKEKIAKLQGENADENHVAEKLYTELPETSFTRSISNPEAVMRRRRQQKLEKKLQQFRSKDGGPDTGGTLKIYGESLCRDVPYKTLLLSIRDCAQAVVREMLSKYGMDGKTDPLNYCLVQVNSDGSEYILDDDECPLSILMNHPTSRGSIMFHVRRRPADTGQTRRRKKKPLGISNGNNSLSTDREGPALIEVTHSGDGGKRVKLTSDPLEVGSANTNSLQVFGPSIQPRHCLISLHEGVCTVTPLHADAITFVNGHHITQPTILHNGSVVMFGRGTSYRFVDSPSDGRYNLALSQSQLDSAYLYESRSTTTPTWHDDTISEQQSTGHNQLASPQSLLQSRHDASDVGSHVLDVHSSTMKSSVVDHHRSLSSLNPNLNKDDNDSILDGNNEKSENEILGTENDTKSITSNKSSGSQQESRMNQKLVEPPQGQEQILPAVLEFPELHQDIFLRQVITELDVNAPNFKLAPVYTLYLCARYRASTHYRPELQPTERAHKLTIFLHQVANLIYNLVSEQQTDPKVLSFWIANASEFLHFLKSDRHISAFSVQAQEVLAESVQVAFRNLVSIFCVELSQTLSQFLSENIDHDSAAGLVLSVLGSAMALLRRCRVNAALTIQLFSQLFHYINVVCFNKFVTTSHMCTSSWGKALTERLNILEIWAEKQGLELAADCHLAKINQCAQFLQAPKTSEAEVKQLACTCFRLNSLQMAALLSQATIPRSLIDTAILMAESVADELTRADGREVCLEESSDLPLALLMPDDGFSCEVVRGIPAGLVDFLAPLQNAGMCRLAAQPTSIGLWTVYMHQFNGRSPSVMSSKLPQPEIQLIKLHKNANGMGLSIVAAKGAGQERLGIYIKSVVPGGAADIDGRLQAGDQLLRVDGQSLIGITQERAADYLVRTGPIVTLEVAKQGAIYHGLATLLQQPSPVTHRDNPLILVNSGKNTPRLTVLSASDECILMHRNSISKSKEKCGGGAFISRDPYRRLSTPDMRYPYQYQPPPPPMRHRYSLSLSNDDILSNDQLQQIHFDPRYRDCRSISNISLSSNSSKNHSINSLNSVQLQPQFGESQSRIIAQSKKWDTNPSIYIEEFVDEPTDETDKQSASSASIVNSLSSVEDIVQPLDEMCIKSISSVEEIPFIDDEFINDGLKQTQQHYCNIRTTPQKSQTPCRKTVSFEVLRPRLITPRNSVSNEEFNKNLNGTNNIRKQFGKNNNMNLCKNKNVNDNKRNSRNYSVTNQCDITNDNCTITDKISIKTIEGETRIETVAKLRKAPSKTVWKNEISTDCEGGRKITDFDRNEFSSTSNGKPPLPNSKSVPALHHGSGSGLLSNPSAATANKSRSINNLIGSSNINHLNNSHTNSIDQGFYQNLSVYRAAQQNQSQPHVGERAPIPILSSSNTTTISQQQLNRPSSAYFNSSNNSAQNNNLPFNMSHAGQHPNSSSISNPNLNQVLTQQQQTQMMRPGPSNAKAPNTFIRDSQAQQSLRLMQNQMMAPSMPNIAHPSGYATNIHSANSQSMQNVNTISGPGANISVQSPINFQNGLYIPGYVSPPEHPHSLRMSTGGVSRVAQLQKQMHANSIEQISAYPMGYGGPMLQSPQKVNPQLMGQSQQQQGFNPNRTMSPMTVTKSHKPPIDIADTPPLPPTSTHPLYKTSQNIPHNNFNYVASTNEPPKVGLYPNQNMPQGHAGKQAVPPSGNPWEREEREKEQEIRREQIRIWRDQQISDLTSIPNRNQQQEEQLKTLLLERDFERRAIEEQAEEENDEKYAKDNVQEVLRLANQTRKTVEIRSSSSGNTLVNAVSTTDTAATSTTTKVTQISDVSPTTIQSSTNQNQNMNVQPKSILKHYATGNLASPSKQQNKTATFIDKSLNLTEITMNNTNANQMMSQMNKLNLNEDFESGSPGFTHNYLQHENNSENMPPPPPERNSSYLIMAQQQKFRSQQQNLINNNTVPKQSHGNHSQQNNNNNIKNSQNNNPSGTINAEIGFVTSPSVSTSSTFNSKIDNKRVSFHDEDNGNLITSASPLTPLSTTNASTGSGIEQAELAIIREDPNKFIEETAAMLQSPTTPDGEQWNLQIQTTPGVIGAQEVYRDPRTKRLAEELNKKQSADSLVPEKLSFKEKMKMFALETGEAQTPKDKLKISRAQRDIDAVH